MKPFKDQGWPYYNKCKTIMYASKARGGRAFFAGMDNALAPVASSSGNITTSMAPIASASSSNDSAGTTDTFVHSFERTHRMSNMITSLYAAQSQANPTPFQVPSLSISHLMRDDEEPISISSSNYGVKRSHDSMTTTSDPPLSQSQSLSSQQSQPSAGPSSHPNISSNSPPSPPKKRSKGSKTSDNVIVPPSRTQKEKVTAAVAVNGMQGTINRMTDMLANVLDPNALAAAFITASASTSTATSSSNKRAALKHLKHDNGLDHDEKARLLNIFTKNPEAAETYVELLDDDEL